MSNREYVIIPDTQQKVYEGSVVMLFRLPNLKWILRNGYYNYNGRKRKGWYFCSIPADTEMPVFTEDLVRLKVLEGGEVPCPPGPGPGPIPPGPGPFPPVPPGPGPCPPVPPAPIPIPFTPQDKRQVDAAMITVDTLEDRDRMGSEWLNDGKIVRVNDSDGQGTVEYYSWNHDKLEWEEASLGYRYMTRAEIEQAIGDDIVEIKWSDEHGALVLTNNAGTELPPVKLFGVAHDPIYAPEELKLTIPIYGKDDFEMVIPKDTYVKSIRYEAEWLFDDGHIGPAIVITVTDGTQDTDIAGDASDLVNIYEGSDTATARIRVDGEECKIVADVKLSSLLDNPIKVDNEGLWVDLSGVVGKQQIQTGFLLVADGNGEFTYAGNGIEIETSTAISDLTNPEKKVVTANLIADAISAAFSALEMTLEARIHGIENRIDFGEGMDGDILVSSGNRLARANYRVGNEVLDPESENTVATEKAVAGAISWNTF